MAGEGGFEPPLTDPESAVLPLDDSPTDAVIINHYGVEVNAKGQKAYREAVERTAPRNPASINARPRAKRGQG